MILEVYISVVSYSLLYGKILVFKGILDKNNVIFFCLMLKRIVFIFIIGW